jgi:hypothetical protein
MLVNCTNHTILGDSSIVVARCIKTCAHILTFSKWKGKIIIYFIDELLKLGNIDMIQNFDEML